MKLGELQPKDNFYIIHWEGGHIGYIDKCIVKDTLDIKIGKIIHYTITDEIDDTIYSVTLEFNEYNNNIAAAYYLSQICSDKETLINKINEDKEKVLNRYNDILNNL